MPDAAIAHMLTRQSHRRQGAEPTPFLRDLTLERGRVHEFCGLARRRLALAVAAGLSGPVFWIKPSWVSGGLNAQGVQALIDPSRLTFLSPKRPEDLLWCMEEVLRAGLVSLVVADLPQPPGLTAVRRLHLAAETGGRSGRLVPLGVLLAPDMGGAPGVETRWSLTPRHGTGGEDGWRLERVRARMEPEKSWMLSGDDFGKPLPVHRSKNMLGGLGS